MKNIALAFVLMLALQGCSWIGADDWFTSSPAAPEQAKNDTYAGAFPFEQMAPEAPPPPRKEYKGNPPGNIPDEYTWRQGHYEYKDGAGFNWASGYWLRKPAFSASWKQDAWMQRAYGWALVPGRWE